MIAFLVAFLAMEAVSYAMHRWVMHGVGWGWHRSHHEPRRGRRLEENDRFPIVFATLSIVLFATGRWWVAAGVTAYGVLYAVVHEIYIHRRVRIRLPRTKYLDWLRSAHAEHHRDGGEPYGMLLPITRSARARL
jgi:beta-carotene 3-hydroxylase